MQKYCMIIVLMVLICVQPAVAQSTTRRNIYTTFDGALQVEVPRGWRFGSITPDPRESPPDFEAPTSYVLTLNRSRPNATITLTLADFYSRYDEGETSADFSLAEAFYDMFLDELGSGVVESETMLIDEKTIYKMTFLLPSRQDMVIGDGVRISTGESPQTIYFTNAREGWLLVATWEPQHEGISIEEDILAIMTSVVFNGVSRHITTLGGDIEMTLPPNWFRNRTVLDRSGLEEFNIFDFTGADALAVGVEIIPVDSNRYVFPNNDAPLQDYLDAYIAELGYPTEVISVDEVAIDYEALLAEVDNENMDYIGLIRFGDGRVMAFQFSGEGAEDIFLEIMDGVTLVDNAE